MEDPVAIVSKNLGELSKDFRLSPHVAASEEHLGRDALPLSALVTVTDARKFAKQLRKALLAPKGDDVDADRQSSLSLIMQLHSRAILSPDAGETTTEICPGIGNPVF